MASTPEFPDSPESTHNQFTYSVSEISGAIKRAVEDNFGYVRVRGEVSGYRGPHSSGHAYFKIKDDQAVMDAVCWKGTMARLPFRLEEGMEVVCTGKVTTYPARSNYQMVVNSIEPAGVGALMAMLEARKKALAAEGLFDAARKKPIPFLPRCIGIVTSPTGAVIRDILHRLADRWPVEVVLWSVAVQGESAAAQIAAAIKGLNSLPEGGAVTRPDVIIVARGGGSIEDLWAFNEEAVVRAAAASAIPLISAVGHETDTTLIDFASDKRAPTPTAAAEMAVPVREEWRMAIDQHGLRLRETLWRNLERQRERVQGLQRGLPALGNLFDLPTQRLDDVGERLLLSLPRLYERRAHALGLASAGLRPQALMQEVARKYERLGERIERLQQGMHRQWERAQQKLERLAPLLESMSYENVLKRGFAMVTNAEGALITAPDQAAPMEQLTVTFAKGKLKVLAQ